MNVKKELTLLIANNTIDDDSIEDIRERIKKIKDALCDIYNIVDIWYQSGCEFPFEMNMNINGVEKIIKFDNIEQMVSTIRLLE